MKQKTDVESHEQEELQEHPWHRLLRAGRLRRHGQTQRAHVYTAASITVDSHKKMDPMRLAVNSGSTCARSTAAATG